MTITPHATSTATTSTPTTTSPATGPAVIRMRGMEIRPRVTAADSGGTLSVLEQSVEPGAGSPPHRCLGETKVIAVVEGTFEVLLDTRTVRVDAGEVALVAPGVRHCFTNVGDAAGRLIVTVTPGGHEQFLSGLAAMGGPAHADPVALAAHCARYRVDLRG